MSRKSQILGLITIAGIASSSLGVVLPKSKIPSLVSSILFRILEDFADPTVLSTEWAQGFDLSLRSQMKRFEDAVDTVRQSD
jgi:hypothetical protein